MAKIENKRLTKAKTRVKTRLNTTKQPKQQKEKVPALFLEIPASTNKLLVAGAIRQWVKTNFVTKAKNILINPVDMAAYETLLNYKNEALPFTIRPTRNSERKNTNNEQPQNQIQKPAIVPNLFAVIHIVYHQVIEPLGSCSRVYACCFHFSTIYFNKELGLLFKLILSCL